MLSNPIMLHVIDSLDIAALLHLRLVSKSINGLICCYESSIAKAIAKDLCPDGSKDKLVDFRPSALRDVDYFVRLNLAHDLAIKAVASRQIPRLGESLFEGIAPDDDLGDEIRARVRNGLMVFSELSRIHKNVTNNSSRTTAKRLRAGIHRLAGAIKPIQRAREKDFLRPLLEYTSTLAAEDLIDHGIAICCVQGKVTSDNQGTADSPALWNDLMTYYEYQAIDWTIRHLSCKGLGFLDRLWSEDQSLVQTAKAEMQAEMKRRPTKLINQENSTFNELLRKCGRDLPNRRNGSTVPDPGISEAASYYESTFACRIGPFHNGMAPDELRLFREEATYRSIIRDGWLYIGPLPGRNWRRNNI